MPPRKKAAAKQATPLTGYTVALSGTFPGTTQGAVQNSITSLGGDIAKTVNAETTYLVSTQADVDKQSTKVKAAQKHDTPIVTLEWLDACVASGAEEDANDYLLSANAAPSQKANGKKRAASPVAAPAPDKKTKTAPAAPADAEPKFGEGSVLKSRDMVIPIDEGCPLTGYRVYVDDDGVVYDASLNQTNASNNNNKFYRVQVCAPSELQWIVR